MYKISKLVSNRRAWGLMVTRAGRVHVETLAAFLAEALDGREGFDAAQAKPFILAFCHWLEEQTDDMGASEQAYAVEQGDDIAPRARRDELVESGRAAIMGLRTRVAELMGAGAPRRFAIPTTTPQPAGEVVDALETIAAAMKENPERKSDALGMTFDTADAAVGLIALAADIRSALDTVATEQRELEAALITRNRKVANWTRSYRAVAGILSNLFRAAGEQELGERVRPTERRATGESPPAPEDLEAVDPHADPAPADVVEPA